MSLGVLAFLAVLGRASGERPASAAVVLDGRTVAVVSGSKLYLEAGEGEREAFGVCLVGNMSACSSGGGGESDSRCALRSRGCRCWQWVASAEWAEAAHEDGAAVTRSAERPDCLVVTVDGSKERVTRELTVRNLLLENGNRFLTRGGRTALENVHRSVWGDDPMQGGSTPMSRSRFVALHAQEWCDRTAQGAEGYPCEGDSTFVLHVETYPRDKNRREKTLLYYGWPLGVVFATVGVVTLADRTY